MKRLLWLALAAVLFSTPALSASAPLSGLSAGSAISGTDLFYDVQSVGTGGVKVTGTQLNTFVWGQGGATTSGTAATFGNTALLILGTSTGATTLSSANSSSSGFTATLPANTGTLAELNLAQTWSAAQSFNTGDLLFSNSGGGKTTLAGASSASNFTATFPANTGTVAELNLAQTWSAAQSFNNADLLLNGSSSGATTVEAPATGGGTATFFPGSDTIAGIAATQTFTNKTYDTAGTGNVFKINGTQITAISGNTGTVGTTTGALTSTHCVNIDASGNLKDSGSTCGGGGGSPGGSNTDVQFNNSSAFGGDAGFTYGGQGTNPMVTIATGTVTANTKALNITSTWNASGVAFDAPIFENITNTASAAGSLLIDLQVGGVSIFAIDPADGSLLFPNANGNGGVISSAPKIKVNGSNPVFQFIPDGSNAIVGMYTNRMFTSNNSTNGGVIELTTNADTGIMRVAAGIVGSQDSAADKGWFEAQGFITNGSAPTLTGTCSTSTQVGGNTAGTFKATCSAQTVIMTFALTAPNGWSCIANDQTTVADKLQQTSTSQTTATLTGTTAAADVINFICMAY